MSTLLSKRIRPDSEVHPWIYKEILLLEAENERQRQALHGISLGSQNSMASKESLGRAARAALGIWGDEETDKVYSQLNHGGGCKG